MQVSQSAKHESTEVEGNSGTVQLVPSVAQILLQAGTWTESLRQKTGN